MARTRFVTPDTVIIYLDEAVAAHRLRQAEATLAALPEDDRAGFQAEVDQLSAALREAEADRSGDWIEIKKRLTFAEGEALRAEALTGGNLATGGVDLRLNMARYKLARFEAWLIGWSFRGADGKPVKLTPMSVASLDEETADEIEIALDAHVAALEAEKANPPGRTAPSATSR